MKNEFFAFWVARDSWKWWSRDVFVLFAAAVVVVVFVSGFVIPAGARHYRFDVWHELRFLMDRARFCHKEKRRRRRKKKKRKRGGQALVSAKVEFIETAKKSLWSTRLVELQ